MKIIGIVLLVLCFLITLALGAQNQEVVNFNYLVAQGEFRLSLLLGVVFGSGFALGWLICGMLYIRAKMSVAMMKKQVNRQRQELDKLRIDAVKE
ncbi:lipopolysaccharide assembly protein LapA domain-containing protein [Enterovibrio makurazakiensis]|uniref:Probable lipopolysaccharide assembly protein A n=1 Tax=Enterovibrio gelatinilyticus TaxID=2899819 RepID=A0ABT5R3I2_9GAMM|nr:MULTISPECIES: lipopolysaccharide assembly protein LapA domain-containing protein [Enterovibrio]MDD1794828.1 lipopolysaccharide assembly protein LapA domain-containing protein [Enterovibrio sp. ZSDZ42]